MKMKETNNTPEVIFSKENKRLSMRGSSYPENAYDYYDNFLKELEEYLTVVENPLNVDLEIIYMNSSSSKVFYDIFELLLNAKNNGNLINVNWIYDEENCSAEENGEDYQEDFEELDIQLVVKE